MDSSTPEYWLAIALPAVATFVGVLLAFWLDRIAERRRQDSAALWTARHFTARMAQVMTEKPSTSALRLLAGERPLPPRDEVYRQLAEVHPALAWAWWYAMRDMLKSRERRGWLRAPENLELKKRAARIEHELEIATHVWPPRRWRIARLLDAFGVEPIK